MLALLERKYEMEFNIWLRRKREEADLTQADLARRINKSRQYINIVESGFNISTGKPFTPPVEVIRDIVKALRAKGLEVTETEAFKEAGLTAVKDLPENLDPPTVDVAVELLDQISTLTREWLKTRAEGQSDVIEDVTVNTSERKESDAWKEITPLAKVLIDLFGGPYVQPYREPPFGGYVSAGTGEYYQAEIATEEDDDRLWRVTISGDSMWTGYQPGDEMIIRETPYPVVGKDIVFLYRGQPVFKRLLERSTKGKPRLHFKPLNHRFVMPEIVPEDDVQILGVVKKLLMDPTEATRLREENEALRRLLEQKDK